MKRIFLPLLICFGLISCHKSIDSGYDNDNLLSLKQQLAKQVTKNVYSTIDFNSVVTSRIKDDRNIVRIGFVGKDILKDFLMMETDNLGKILKGNIFHLEKNAAPGNRSFQYNGVISIRSFDERLLTSDSIVEGYIKGSNVGGFQLRSLVVPTKQKDTAVVLTGTDVGDSPINYTDWINISSYYTGYTYYTGYGGGTYAYFGSFTGLGGTYSHSSYGGATYGTYSGPVFTPELKKDFIFVDYELSEDLSPIDLNKYLKCFSAIPDNGATCSIEIFTDIPVDNDPNKLFNWSLGSPGHTFIQIKKTNGTNSLMQNIGFYPNQRWKTMVEPGGVDAKFADNSEHEFNASLKMSLTAAQLKNTINKILSLSQSKYDIEHYNCTDFALDVFNCNRPNNPLTIDKYYIPGTISFNGSSTPQGVYKKLKTMKDSGVEAPNITFPGFKGFVADSNGPCN
jgi:hypothetical protein